MDNQGKRRDQLEFSYTVVFFGMAAIILTVVLTAIFN